MSLTDNTPTEEAPVNTSSKTWRPVVGGMFSLIIGTVNIYLSIILAIIASSLEIASEIPYSGWVYGIPIFLLGIITITGGFFTLGRRKWKLSLTGAICGLVFPAFTSGFLIAVRSLQTLLFLLPLLTLGIIAMVLTFKAKPEFK